MAARDEVSDHEMPTTLLLVLPLPIYGNPADALIDGQAINGLKRWLENFDRLILCMPELPREEAGPNCEPYDPGALEGRCQLVTLPAAYSPFSFFRVFGPVRSMLSDRIDQSTHLSFAIGGLFGDWGAVGALIANRKKRTASVWTDRVESQVTRIEAYRNKGLKKLYRLLQAFAMAHYERAVIRRSSIGLFHGSDCYSAYSRYSANPHLVHDIHLSETSRIAPSQLERKIFDTQNAATPLSIIYAGRVHPDKGPLDWVAALKIVDQQGVDFDATWYGVGPELKEARQAVFAAKLERKIKFAGNVNDRGQLMARLRDSHVFLFCHITPESPRCLIEALISGTPIIGYSSDYARDLIEVNQGGVLTAHKPADLASEIVKLALDRSSISDLMRRAAADGLPMNDTQVFRHRSNLIKAGTKASS